ncbi:uncharacterized protein [Leuresthes tenuis]|uniref:uncharacterized protein isoform X2 n=1 Tax=Leuresthes tenuis TaxID=355514 RepID=UPI003B505EED
MWRIYAFYMGCEHLGGFVGVPAGEFRFEKDNEASELRPSLFRFVTGFSLLSESKTREGCLRAPHLTENSKNKHHKVLKMQFQALLGFLFPVTYLIESVMAMSLGSLKKDGQLLDDRKITCFNSSDPVAVNATIVFDFYIDHVTLWERDPKDPLPRCSSSFSSSSSRCNVCQLRMVFIMCSDLTAGAEVTMEGNGAPITIETIDCLKIPSDDGDSAQMGTSAVPQMGTPVIHISFPIVAFIAIVIVVAVVLINRR